MAVLNRETFLSRINAILGDRSDDEALSFIEDATDTFDDITSKASDPEDWKKKYEDNDKEWRDKYRKRFFDGASNDKRGNDPNKDNDPNTTNNTTDEVNEDITIGELFT